MTVSVIDYINPWPLSGSLLARRKSLMPSQPIDHERVKDWPTMRRIVTEIAATAGFAKCAIESMSLERLNPQENMPWERRADLGLAILPVVTNPAVFVLPGPRAPVHIEAGNLAIVDQSWPVCVVNWGRSPHLHLHVRFSTTVKDE